MKKILLFTALLPSMAWAYTPPKGIPDPGNWGSTHPIDATAPSTATKCPAWPTGETAGCYRIDNSTTCTDTANTYGYPDNPRCTIPETTYAAGSYISVGGGSYYWRGGDNELDVTFNCTSGDPCWLVGDAGINPVLYGTVEFAGSYVIAENFSMYRDTTLNKGPILSLGGDSDVGDHIAIRSFTLTGDSTFHSGYTSTISIGGTVSADMSNIIIYNTTVQDINSISYARTVASDDDHCIVPGQYSSYVWILNSTLQRCSGDGIQVSGNNALGAARADHIYIGNNEIADNGENAIDVKSSVDVIISENDFHDHYDSVGSDGVAIVVQQEGGDGSDNVWAIFNDFHGNRRAFRAEEVVTNTYLLGNIIHQQNDETGGTPTSCSWGGAQVYFRTDNVTAHVIDNTFYAYEAGIAFDNDPDIEIQGNVFVNRTESTSYDFCASTDNNVLVGGVNYEFFDSGHPFLARVDGVSYTSLSAFQSGESQCASCGYGAASLVSASDLSPTESSPLISANVENAAYGVFYARYGISIQKDYTGTAWPVGSWDIGAYEFGSGGGGEPPPPAGPAKFLGITQ